ETDQILGDRLGRMGERLAGLASLQFDLASKMFKILGRDGRAGAIDTIKHDAEFGLFDVLDDAEFDQDIVDHGAMGFDRLIFEMTDLTNLGPRLQLDLAALVAIDDLIGDEFGRGAG